VNQSDTNSGWYNDPLNWPEDTTQIAFQMETEDNERTIFINEHFPTYREIFDNLSLKSELLADRYKSRFQLYLSAWCLRMERLAEGLDNPVMKPEPDYQRGMNVQFAECCAYQTYKEIEQEVELAVVKATATV
jgi:hypothetical protein